MSSEFNIYGYVPSLGGGAAFVAIFGILTIVHTALAVRSKFTAASIVIAVGGLAETIGWVGRIWSHLNIASLNAFLIQQICLILAPTFFSAAIYTFLGYLINSASRRSPRSMSAKTYLIVFITCDIVALVAQAIGGAMAAIALQNSEDSVTGTHIMVAGIAAQLASMLVFCVLALDFYRTSQKIAPDLFTPKTNRMFLGIAIASFWILVRCIYRTIELAQGWEGYLITHEVFFFVLDSIPMVFTMVALVYGHPHFCLEPTILKKSTDSTKAGSFEEDKKVLDSPSASV